MPVTVKAPTCGAPMRRASSVLIASPELPESTRHRTVTLPTRHGTTGVRKPASSGNRFEASCTRTPIPEGLGVRRRPPIARVAFDRRAVAQLVERDRQTAGNAAVVAIFKDVRAGGVARESHQAEPIHQGFHCRGARRRHQEHAKVASFESP